MKEAPLSADRRNAGLGLAHLNGANLWEAELSRARVSLADFGTPTSLR